MAPFLLLHLLLLQVALSVCSVNGAISLRIGEIQPKTINGSSPNTSGSSSPLFSSPNQKFTLQWSSVSGNQFILAVVYLAGSNGSPVIWIANRNKPVSANASLLVQPNGNLVLRERDNTIVWSTNTVDSWQIDLLDSGNLVVTDATGRQLWQSFDYPTDTLLPGQTIRTGQRVVSGVSLTDMREGLYSIAIVPGGLIMFVVFDNTSLPYHVAGFDDANTVQSVMNPLCNGTSMMYSKGGGQCIFQQDDAGAECNRSFSVRLGSNENENLKFFRLDNDGNVRTYIFRRESGWVVDHVLFSGSTACSLPNHCGGFGVCSALGICACLDHYFKWASNSQLGCERISEPVCNSSDNKLIEHRGVNYFMNNFVNQSLMTIDECRKSCADSCDCTAVFYDKKTGRCFRYISVMSLRQVEDSSYVAFVKVNNKSLGSNTAASSSLPRHVLDGIIAGTIVCTAVLITLFSTISKLCKKISEMNEKDEFLDKFPGLPYRFSFKELKTATDGFRHKLGGGGFGSVYEGKLEDGSKVAVKRLESARQGHKEFHAEVETLGSLNHLNLVHLRGFCVRGTDRLLVYEHMSNGSLDKWLFQKGGERSAKEELVLDWETRYKIAVDTARGLAFLHEESRECIVHLDVKPQNILLDESFTAKLSDFGLSRLIDRYQDNVVTNMKGTPGYLAPEWLFGTAITSKSDVYSFGMVLLELVSGRRNLDLSRGDYLSYLPAWAVLQMELNGSMEDIVDKRLAGISSSDADQSWPPSLLPMMKLAFWCIQEDPIRRPSMGRVLHMLQEGLSQMEEPPSLLQFAYRTVINRNVPFQQENNDPNIHTNSTDITNCSLSAPR